MEVRIDEKQVQIKVAKRELKDAEATKASQYESMKARIRFIYERGGVDLAAVFLGSSSMAELLNKAEYVEEINRYDREMLNLYEETCKQITEKKQNLKSEKAELLAMQESMEQKKEEVNSLIAKTQKNISAKQGEISDAQDEVGEYDNQIAKMKAYEEERKKRLPSRKSRREAVHPITGIQHLGVPEIHLRPEVGMWRQMPVIWRCLQLWLNARPEGRAMKGSGL